MAWDDKPRPVVNSREKMAHVAKAFQCFEGRRYYPGNLDAVRLHCECLANIVWDKPIGEVYDQQRFGKFGDTYPSLGDVENENDLDWLIKRALVKCGKECPSLRELRNMYCRYFTPADGVMVNDREEE